MKQSMLIKKLVLACDLLRLSFLARSFKNAYRYLRQSDSLDQIDCHYRGLKFTARREDWPALREVFFDDEYECFENIFSSNETLKVLDLGAHIGSFALRIFAYNKFAEILSVEAVEDTYRLLEKNKKLNPSLNWRIFRGAVWKEKGTVYLDRAESSVGHRVSSKNTGETVNGLTPDEILEKSGWDEIDFIKMDIEGAEEEVITVSDRLMTATKYLLIEIHNDRIKNGEVIFSDLKKTFGHAYKIKGRFSDKPLFLFSKGEVSNLKGWEAV